MKGRGQAGDVMLEFILAFPIVLLCVFAVLQFAMILTGSLIMQYAAYSAARAGLVYQGDSVLWEKTAQKTGIREFEFEGLEVYGQTARNEAQLAGCEAAAQVCSLLTMASFSGEAAKDEALTIPGWGPWKSSAVARRKTRAWLSNHRPTLDGDGIEWPTRPQDIERDNADALGEWSKWPSDKNEWNVYAVVEHDFELIMPIIGELLAWGQGITVSVSSKQQGLTDKEEMRERGYERSGRVVPHLRLVETCVLPKPYKTVVPTGIYGAVPQSMNWFTDVGYLYWLGDNPNSAQSVLLMQDTGGVTAQEYHYGQTWTYQLDFGKANPLQAKTMTVSLDVAGIHTYGDRLTIAGVEIFNFDSVIYQWVQDIEHMHHFEVTLGEDKIKQIFSNPIDQWKVGIELQSMDDVVWRNLHIGFNE